MIPRPDREKLSQTPRYSGPRTFMRLPFVPELEQLRDGVDVAVLGIPTDDAVGFRSGARFGPEAVRSSSVLLRPYNPELDVDVFDALTAVDAGDAPTVPGYTVESLERVQAFLTPVMETARTVCIGGDHSITLAELRAAASVHGPLGLIHLDAHPDVIDSYYGMPYFHGTVFRRAAEEGLLDPGRVLQAGLRGSLFRREERTASAELGFRAIPWRELRQMPAAEFGALARETIGSGPAFLSFDIDFIDPGFAPGTGTPEPGGPSSSEAFEYLRSLAGIAFVGFDCVEVSPPFDPTGVTAMTGAVVCHELLSLAAVTAPGGSMGAAHQPRQGGAKAAAGDGGGRS